MTQSFNRRHLIKSMVCGSMLMPSIVQQLMASGSSGNPLAPRAPHYGGKAKRVIFMFLTGGVSHIDTFDPKPATGGRDGFERPDKLMGSIWPYSPDPKTGTEVSDLFANVRTCMEDICLVRSMKAAHFDHTEATLGMHTCSPTFARPSWGSWLSYGLGSENENLPSFMVIAPKLPYGGTQVYGNDFLPAFHQGTRIYPGKEPVENLTPRADSLPDQARELDFTAKLNRRHFAERETDSNLAARIRSFETAFHMQMAGPEAFDVSKESDATLNLYGLKRGQTDSFAWQCLMARRLAERGVRCIEVIHKGSDSGVNWDQHSDMKNYEGLAREVDHPMAGLLKDLKSRGLLDDTIVVFATEFGRTPARDGKYGRHHHSRVFSIWLAGGGFKPGFTYGGTDDIGYDSTVPHIMVDDLHATILHQLGMDHERLTYRHAGLDFKLTGIEKGRVAHELLV